MIFLVGLAAASVAMLLCVYSYVRSRRAIDENTKGSSRTHAQVFGVISIICTVIFVTSYNKIGNVQITDLNGGTIATSSASDEDDDGFVPPPMPAMTSTRGIVFDSQEEAERWCSYNNSGADFDSVIAESYEKPAAPPASTPAPQAATLIYATEGWPEACPGAKIRAPGKGADNCYILDCEGGGAFHLARENNEWKPCPTDSSP